MTKSRVGKRGEERDGSGRQQAAFSVRSGPRCSERLGPVFNKRETLRYRWGGPVGQVTDPRNEYFLLRRSGVSGE